MNEQSLNESNGILAAAAEVTEVGQVISLSPAELARRAGIENRLSAARAMRALMARGRIAQDGGGYRLLEARPLEPDEPATVRRPVRRRARPPKESDDGPPTYDRLGKAVIERLVELSAESAELRAALDRARSEADAARREAVEVTRQAAGDRRRVEALEDESAALKRQLEMAETNLRTVMEAARSRSSTRIEDSEAQAILDILSRTEETAEKE